MYAVEIQHWQKRDDGSHDPQHYYTPVGLLQEDDLQVVRRRNESSCRAKTSAFVTQLQLAGFKVEQWGTNGQWVINNPDGSPNLRLQVIQTTAKSVSDEEITELFSNKTLGVSCAEC